MTDDPTNVAAYYDTEWLDPTIRYLALQAPHDSAAQELAKRAYLPLDGNPLGSDRGVSYFTKRLILFGLDTDRNLALFFGPTWRRELQSILSFQRSYAMQFVGNNFNGRDVEEVVPLDWRGEGTPKDAKVRVRDYAALPLGERVAALSPQ